MKKNKTDYFNLNEEEREKFKKKIAKTIWDNPFFSGINKLKKEELKAIVESLINKWSWENDSLHELDIKDLLFEEKCYLIESLDEEFFKNEKEQ